MLMAFPTHRLRRLRKTSAMRNLFQETRLHPSDFVLPLFVDESLKTSKPIDSMPGVQRHSLSSMLREAEIAKSLGIPAVILFGIPKHKDPGAKEAYNPNG